MDGPRGLDHPGPREASVGSPAAPPILDEGETLETEVHNQRANQPRELAAVGQGVLVRASRDVSSVELLMNRHQGIKAEVDGRNDNLSACVQLGKALLANKHFAAPQVRTHVCSESNLKAHAKPKRPSIDWLTPAVNPLQIQAATPSSAYRSALSFLLIVGSASHPCSRRLSDSANISDFPLNKATRKHAHLVS